MVLNHPDKDKRPSTSRSTTGHHGVSGQFPSRPATSSGASARPSKPPSSATPSREGNGRRAVQDVVGLKDYQLGDCLGKGAFGSVYRALNWGTGETVAVKQIKLENLPKSELKTIMLEIDLLKNLNHDNIVKYHGFVKSPESLYIILEYCENGSLHSICKNFGKFPENLVALYMSQVLQGLIYLHEQGVIHRDIKGANILTTKQGLVKLADFGVATKAAGLDESSVVGTPYWMAPEVIELSGATTASDIWSLGCTVIELIEGKPPYHKLQPMQALFRIVNDEHPPIPGSASPALRNFLMECFQKNPTLRIDAKRLLKNPWIASAKRTSSVPTKPTEYDETVRSIQKWNERLKSPSSNSLRRNARLGAGLEQPKQEAQFAVPLASRKPSAALKQSRSNADVSFLPEIDTSDNWDDDFEATFSPSALNLAHLKPQDNFGGALSADRLKAYATTNEHSFEESAYMDHTTVRSPPQLLVENFDGPETVRPSPARSRQRLTKASHDPEPKTAILRGIPQSTPPMNNKVAALARPSVLYRENTFDDYSDLVLTDEDAFEKKVKALQVHQPAPRSQTDYFLSPPETEYDKPSTSDPFSPRLFHPSDLKTTPRSISGNSRQRSTSSTSGRKMQRSQSEIEIQKYAEPDKEDFSDIFGHDGVGIRNNPESDSGSEHSLAVINTKYPSYISNDEDETDAFADLEEDVQDINLETSVARDLDDRLTKQTEGFVGNLHTSLPADLLCDVADGLIQVLYTAPEKKAVVLKSHGILPILEILVDNPPPDLACRLLKIVNMVILDDAQAQENLGIMGGIPVITNFATKRNLHSAIRREAAAFVRQLYQTSTPTFQMFLVCGGLNVLVEFVGEDLVQERDLVLIGVNGIWSVFDSQAPSLKNDFCRQLAHTDVLKHLSLILGQLLNETGDVSDLLVGRIVNIFLIFSQAETYVKDIVADQKILKRVLRDLRRMSPGHQVTMLKFIKNLSTLPSTHQAMENSSAIDILIELLKSSRPQKLFVEISNQILTTLFNICHHNRSRQEEAAEYDIIPILKEVVQTARPLKEFALPLLCELAHAGTLARGKLWENRGLQFYISMLSERNWMVPALESITIWLQEETARVEQYLLHSDFSKAIIDAYASPLIPQLTFHSFLEPLYKLVRISPAIASSLAMSEMFSRSVSKLRTKEASARLNVLRILRTICDATDEQCTLIKKFGVYDAMLSFSKRDPAVLVSTMAKELIDECDGMALRNASRSGGFRRPQSSASRAGSGSSSSNGSFGRAAGMGMGMTAMTPPTPTLMHSFSLPQTPGPRERVGRSQSSADIYGYEGGRMPNVYERRDSVAVTNSHTPNSSMSLIRPGTSSGLSDSGFRERERDRSSDWRGLDRAQTQERRTPSVLRPASRESSHGLVSAGGSSSASGGGKSRLPKARGARASLANVSEGRERGDRTTERERAEGRENTPTQPMPRLSVVRRRRDTSGGEMGPGLRRQGTA